MNNSCKIGTSIVRVTLQEGHIILGACMTNFSEIGKNSPKMAKISFLWAKYHLFAMYCIYKHQMGPY